MSYLVLAEELLHNLAQFKKEQQLKKISETMQGEIFTIVYILKRGRKVLPSEISAEMNISTARIAAVLNSLERKGIITRQIDSTDRRRILVDLTQEGRKLGEYYEHKMLNTTADMLKALGEEDARELVRIIGKLSGPN